MANKIKKATAIKSAPKAKGRKGPQLPAKTEGRQPEAPAEKVAALSSLSLPIHLMRAAALCIDADRANCAGVFVQAAEGGKIAIVGTNGKELFLAHCDMAKDEEAPAWLADGVLIEGENLVTYLGVIAKISKTYGGSSCLIHYAAGAPKIEVTDAARQATFRVLPIDVKFPDYKRIMKEGGAAFAGGEVGDLRATTFLDNSIKQARAVGAAIGSLTVRFYDGGTKNPSVITFSVPGVALYTMPAGEKLQQEHAATFAVLSPAIRGTIAALKAHQTRWIEAAKTAKDKPGKEAASAKAADYALRIKAAQQLGNPAKALPAPAAAEPKAEAPKGNGSPAPVTNGSGKVVPFNPQGSPDSPAKLTFDAWVKAVSVEVEKQVSVSLNDLPDVPTRDWYDAGMLASVAAKRAIEFAEGV